MKHEEYQWLMEGLEPKIDYKDSVDLASFINILQDLKKQYDQIYYEFLDLNKEDDSKNDEFTTMKREIDEKYSYFLQLKPNNNMLRNTSSQSSIRSQLSSVSEISTQYGNIDEVDKSSTISNNSIIRSSCRLDNLKKPKSKQINLPCHNQTEAKITKKCKICLESHHIYACKSYLSKTSRGRFAVASKLKLCRNCLKFGHKAIDCRNENRCKKCNKKHHTTLHFTKTSSKLNDTKCGDKLKSLLTVKNLDDKKQELTKIKVLIPDAKGNWMSFEAFIDTESNRKILDQDNCQLKLPDTIKLESELKRKNVKKLPNA